MRAATFRTVLAIFVAVSIVACERQDNPVAPPSPAPSRLISTGPVGGVVICSTRYNIDCNPWVEIAAGRDHTCARKQNGAVYCWGRDDRGQVGIGTSERCGLQQEIACVHRPVQVTGTSSVSNFTTATQIDAGDHHSCVIATDGYAWCWGDNSYGQAGPPGGGVYGPPTPPHMVSSSLTFSAIGAGGNRTCAAGQGVYCWGNNVFSPTQVLLLTGVNGVSVASDHSCVRGGILNEVYCWGQNSFGQLGIDASSVGYGWVSQVTGTTRLRVNFNYTCADQPNGTVQCFGLNNSYIGQLGNPLFTGDYTSVAQTVGQTLTGAPLLHGVATGLNHACALDATGAAWCWGNGSTGEAGNPNGIYHTPVQVAGGHYFRALAAGSDHTCGLATDSHIWCWGDNYLAQLGAFTPGQTASEPVQVIDP